MEMHNELPQTPSKRLKLLLSAYACAPNRGSEHGNGWHTVVELSKYHDIWAIVAAEYRQAIENHLTDHPIEHVHWIFADLPNWIVARRKPLQAERIHYYFWQHHVFGLAKKLHDQIGFDASMHVTFGSYWRPSFLRRLPIPFVWGPVGGAENIPTEFYPALDEASVSWDKRKRLIETWACRLDPTVQATARLSAAALAATPHTGEQIRKLGATNVIRFEQCALPLKEIDSFGKFPVRQVAKPIRFISMGRLIGWKGIQLGVRAFAKLLERHAEAEYWHDGSGEMAEDIKQLAQTLGLGDRFKVFENNTRQQALDNLAQSDVLMFPNLHDEKGWVCLEAMAARRPVVYLLGGETDMEAYNYHFMADSQSIERAVDSMAEAMYKLATDDALRIRMGEAARRQVLEHNNFEVHASQYARLFEELVAKATRPA